jgi:UDP-3-O-[3-hydroxymyristoyl] N-acetylglucosamine deacetylase
VTLSILPASAGSGILFKRLDVDANKAYVPARYDLVTETMLGTTIQNEQGTSVSTIEHLMAALWGSGIDNALITLDAPEAPIMDGSSEPFMELLAGAGITKLPAPRRLIRVLKNIEVKDGNSIARLSPNREGEEGLVLSVEIDFNHPMINRQCATYDFRETSFGEALSRARTFGFEHEVDAMRKMGLARGGSLDNAIVLTKEGILNQEGLRFDNEFLRHKALDVIGDIFLGQLRIDGVLDFVRPGHRINNLLMRALFADDSAYALVQADGSNAAVPARENRVPLYA